MLGHSQVGALLQVHSFEKNKDSCRLNSNCRRAAVRIQPAGILILFQFSASFLNKISVQVFPFAVFVWLWLIVGADLLRENNTADWLVAGADLV